MEEMQAVYLRGPSEARPERGEAKRGGVGGEGSGMGEGELVSEVWKGRN